ncbi:MAG: hypothetical protein RR323_04765 [Raoultibacter sp.]
MIQTHAMLLEQLSDYRAPANKLARMVKAGQIFPLVKGLYETDRATSPYLLAGSIYGPSYISFQFALSWHGLIPERVSAITCATFEKKKKKEYETPFGRFTYRDVPTAAFPLGIDVCKEGDYSFRMACPEKALCDQLYTLPPVTSQRALLPLIFDHLRIDKSDFEKLDAQKIHSFKNKYRCTNVKLLDQCLRRLP